jgi:hypothetical protein
MHLKISNIAIIFLFALITINCSNKSNPLDSIGRKEIIPLNLDNTWNYHVTAYDTSGNIYFSANISDKIMGDTIINGQRWYYQDKGALYFTIKSDGYYTIDRYAMDTAKINLAYKYPCNTGDKYSNWEVVKLDTQITVPAGNFSCVLYSYRLKTGDSFSYYDVYIKPGIGRIKTATYGFVDNHPIFVWTIKELISYELN